MSINIFMCFRERSEKTQTKESNKEKEQRKLDRKKKKEEERQLRQKRDEDHFDSKVLFVEFISLRLNADMLKWV